MECECNTLFKPTNIKNTINWFKILADKYKRKMSNIVDNSIRWYVKSGVYFFLNNKIFKCGFDLMNILLKKFEIFNLWIILNLL